MSSYRRYYLPSVSWSDVKGGVWRIQPYNVTDYFFIFRVQNLLTSARFHFFTQFTCFSLTIRWSISSRFHFFTQFTCNRMLVLGLLLRIILQAFQCLLSPKYMHSLASKLAAMHVLGGLSRKNRPALCGVARGC